MRHELSSGQSSTGRGQATRFGARTKVTPAYTLLSQADVKRLRAVLERHGIDGAITLSLVRVEDKTRYVPGMTRTVPGGYYGYYGGMGLPRTDLARARGESVQTGSLIQSKR